MSEKMKVHVALNVNSIEESVKFYRQMFGLDPVKLRSDYAKFVVADPSLNLTLNYKGEIRERGALSHLGIQVKTTEDVLAQRLKWIDAGLISRDEMKVSCCYAIQDKTWVKDPDGNEWEVFVVLEDNLPEKAPNTSAACCAPSASR